MDKIRFDWSVFDWLGVTGLELQVIYMQDYTRIDGINRLPLTATVENNVNFCTAKNQGGA